MIIIIIIILSVNRSIGLRPSNIFRNFSYSYWCFISSRNVSAVFYHRLYLSIRE